MDPSRPRWRIRLSTLMLLVIIAGLASYIIADRWNRQMEARRREARVLQALAEAEQARARAVLLQMQGTSGRGGQSPAGAGPMDPVEWLGSDEAKGNSSAGKR